INDVIELYDAGIDEALDDGIWLIEWPEIGKALLENYVEVSICHANTSRSYIIG
ncbi:bifunctional tRNA (adenosine(37)-N6)-threonylcarbamoyltransferase complex ATPase subunit type 1 TsaE/phosphotransferase, partial [archaeon]|nr:bifunctional tRNA (adenosine(37)-N6)-threonylcarbamoyltransferase complex ATPase subunit type 1 TsaE/phosphotransferase [archaeon]